MRNALLTAGIHNAMQCNQQCILAMCNVMQCAMCNALLTAGIHNAMQSTVYYWRCAMLASTFPVRFPNCQFQCSKLVGDLTTTLLVRFPNTLATGSWGPDYYTTFHRPSSTQPVLIFFVLDGVKNMTDQRTNKAFLGVGFISILKTI